MRTTLRTRNNITKWIFVQITYNFELLIRIGMAPLQKMNQLGNFKKSIFTNGNFFKN